MSDQPLPLLSALELQRLLGRYTRLVARKGSIPLTAQGRIRKTAFKALLRELGLGVHNLGEDEAPQLLFARLALVGLGVLETDREALRPKHAEAWLEQPLTKRAQALLDAWVEGKAWNELVELPGVSVTRYSPPPEGQRLLREVRQTLLAVLGATARAASEHTIPLGALIEHLRRLPFKLIKESSRRSSTAAPMPYYYATENPLGVSLYPLPSSSEEAWERLERAFAIHALSGPLRWMGLVALSEEPRARNLDAVRVQLTEVGRWLILGADPPAWTETGGRIVVQPNFTVLAFEPLPDIVLLDLERFVDLQSADRALTYQLTRESVYRAQLQGWNVPRIVRFLEEHSGRLPANVRRTLEEWEAQHQRIVVRRRACVVQLADAALQADVLESLRAFAPRALGPRFVLVPAAPDEVVRALQRDGWSPHVRAASETEPEASIAEDGTITLFTSLPSLHLIDHLRQVAEVANGDVDQPFREPPRITRESVQRAMERGMTLEKYLETLTQLNRGALPTVLVERIRQWSRFYGSVRAKSLFRLTFSDARVLNNLLSDEATARYLTPIGLPPFTKEAIVEAEHLQQVRALLEARGIAFQEG
ncbi:MAG: helicase-associated domain-containing protein [Thermoflexales bacterium]|nr:helicase-associated domain-containing protein [Thermoflexales bacterium]MDW8291979.1 helicase-associated domain-containing protein [Anaerolineae bacterium]